MDAGVKIYEYEPGFIHAKNFIADDDYAMIGTINLDHRSLVHHFENGVWMYKCNSITDIKNDMDNTFQKCIRMTPDNKVKFEKITFTKRIKSMLCVDFRRMFKSKLFYILIACALIMPILMTVMMAMMDGTVSKNPQTGEETIMVGPENTWQNIGTLPGGEAMGGNEVFMMCNINMIFMIVAVFICLFISDDFRSGYAKNLFTVRAKRGEYVISKTLAGFVCGALMLIAYFLGSMLGGAISSLSFDLHGLTAGNLIMCLLAKIFLMLVFVSIYTLISVSAK